MPPKKKGKKKGKGKGKGKGNKAPPPPEVLLEDDKVDEMSKKFYTVQIIDLEQRLSRYQVKCDKLQLENEDLHKQLKQQLEDQEQMITFLKRKSHEQAEKFMDLEEKLATVQEAKEKQREKLEAQLSQLKEDSQFALDHAATENKLLQDELQSLENFRENKEKLENDLRTKDELIEELKKEHSEVIYKLEKKAVLDKDRMKKEMIAKVNSVAAEFRKVSDIQMAETTKRAIRENVSMSNQLTKMSEKTLEYMRENEQLKVKEKELMRKMDILEFGNQEISKRNASLQRVVRLVKNKAEEQESWCADMEERAMKGKLLEQQLALTQEEISAKDREIQLLQSTMASLEEELAAARNELTRTKEELYKLQNITSHASATIQDSLEIQPTSPEHRTHRENLMATLLQLLNLEPQHISSHVPPLRYQPGDLGLVPPPLHGSQATRHQSSLQLPPINNRQPPSLPQQHT